MTLILRRDIFVGFARMRDPALEACIPTALPLLVVLLAAVFSTSFATRLLLKDRIPAARQHVDRIATVGCDCANPFAVAPDPHLFAAIGEAAARPATASWPTA